MPIRTVVPSSLAALVGSILLVATSDTASAQSVERLAEADANGDGSITRQEMLDMRAATFARLDRNGDGYADSSDSPKMGPGKKKYSEAFGQLKGVDANGDGRISRSEMMNAPAPAFEAGDKDGNKVLSATELATLRKTAGGS